MYSNGQATTVARNIKATEACANVDFKYGPYPSVQEAFRVLDDMEVLAVGLTVGIVTDGKIQEYWFEKACASADDLVMKGVALTPEKQAEIVEGVTENIPVATIRDIMDLFENSIDDLAL